MPEPSQRSVHVWISRETADYLDVLMAEWQCSRSAAIARAVEIATDITQPPAP